MQQVLTIARHTFVESVRQPIVLLVVLAVALLQFLNTWQTGFSMGQEMTGEVKGDDKLLLDIGLATVFVGATLLAGFIATAALSREIERRTVLTVVSKPVSRTALIVGKYLGVAGALTLASVGMLFLLLLALRHGVMTTAADELDGPVLVFGALAIALSLALAAWSNFFYGWSFPQTALTLAVPALALAYLMALLLSKKWEWQPLHVDFKPQVSLACACLLLAGLVLSAVATCASTRLGQVMTIVVCLATFVVALLSNAFIGRWVFSNTAFGQVAHTVAPLSGEPLEQVGDQLAVQLALDPVPIPKVGDSFYYSTSPNGYPPLTRHFEPFAGQLADANQTLGPDVPPALVITKVEGKRLTIRLVGGSKLRLFRPPETEDFVFLSPTRINTPALIAWGVVPNLQYFWLIDAVSQSRHIPASYLWLSVLYALAQVVAFLCLAVILFQRRDVG